MANVKLAVIYYSTYGTNHRMAEIAVEEARNAGADVRLRKARETAPEGVVAGQDAWRAHAEATAHVEEATMEDLEWADAYLFSTPTRYGGATSQMRTFIDNTGPLWARGALAGKAVSVMTSAQNPHGGQETTLLTMYISMMHWGAILVPPGYTDKTIFAAGGNPYGTSVTQAGPNPPTEEEKAAIRHQVRRLVEVARKLKA